MGSLLEAARAVMAAWRGPGSEAGFRQACPEGCIMCQVADRRHEAARGLRDAVIALEGYQAEPSFITDEIRARMDPRRADWRRNPVYTQDVRALWSEIDRLERENRALKEGGDGSAPGAP